MPNAWMTALSCRGVVQMTGRSVLGVSLDRDFGLGVECRFLVGLARHLLGRTGFAGSPETKSCPRCTHLASASSDAKPAGSTQMKADRARPANCTGRTWGSRSACSRPSALTRTISAVPVMPQHMLPLTRNDRPPTILFATTPSRPDSNAVPVWQPRRRSSRIWYLPSSSGCQLPGPDRFAPTYVVPHQHGHVRRDQGVPSPRAGPASTHAVRARRCRCTERAVTSRRSGRALVSRCAARLCRRCGG